MSVLNICMKACRSAQCTVSGEIQNVDYGLKGKFTLKSINQFFFRIKSTRCLLWCSKCQINTFKITQQQGFFPEGMTVTQDNPLTMWERMSFYASIHGQEACAGDHS